MIMISTRHLDCLNFQSQEQRLAVEQVILEVQGHYEDMGVTPVTPSFSQYITEAYRHGDPDAKIYDVTITYDVLRARLAVVSFIVDVEGDSHYLVKGYRDTNCSDDEQLVTYATGDFLVDGTPFRYLA